MVEDTLKQQQSCKTCNYLQKHAFFPFFFLWFLENRKCTKIGRDLGNKEYYRIEELGCVSYMQKKVRP